MLNGGRTAATERWEDHVRSNWAMALLAAAMLAGTAAAQTPPSGETKTAIFAGGCFWCMEEVYDAVEGVTETVSGYTGGTVENPTYEQVSMDTTGHYEAVLVRYDPGKVTYEELLDAFWPNVDPFDRAGQFCDRGSSYLSAIFVADEEQRAAAEATKAEVAEKFGRKVATEVLPAETFYPAEDYHQDYHRKNALQYRFYKWGCGRAQRLEQIWGPKDS